MLFLLPSITFFISFFNFDPLFIREYSSWSETEDGDEHSEQLVVDIWSVSVAIL
ncbi:hypothetical protein Hanom_Chr09g00857951 [Helianthus anomalus]